MKFLEEKTFPERTLAQYSSFIQPTQRVLGSEGTLTKTTPGAAKPTYLQQGLQAAGTAMQVAGMFPMPSDPKIKTDISKIGMDDATGLAMYSFRYKGDPKTYPKVVGPMSTEVKEKYPELVSEVDGIEVVDFGGLASIANMDKEENAVELKSGGLVSLADGGTFDSLANILPKFGGGLDPQYAYVPDEEEELDIGDITEEEDKPEKKDKSYFASLFERPTLKVSESLKGDSPITKAGKIIAGMGGEKKGEDDTLITALSRGADKSIKSIEAEELGKLTAGSKLSKSKLNTAALGELREIIATQNRAMYDKDGKLIMADSKTPISQEVAERIASQTNNALSIFSRLAAERVPDAKAFAIALQSIQTPQVETALSNKVTANPGTGARASGNPLSKFIPKDVPR